MSTWFLALRVLYVVFLKVYRFEKETVVIEIEFGANKF